MPAETALSTTRLAIERTHPYSEDLDWLPARLGALRAIRWVFGGAVLVGFMAIAIAAHGKGVGGMAYAIGMAATGAWYAGDRAARAIVRRRLDRLARGLDDLRRLSREEDGAAVHVRGRVRAQATLPGLVDPTQQAVFRRFLFRPSEQVRVVHEAAVDFALVDESGERITVLVEGARLLAPDPSLVQLPIEMLEVLAALPLPKGARSMVDAMRKRRDKGKKVQALRGGEILLRDGDEVLVVGCKTRVVDQTVAVLERETPMRATLRSGREMPLLISPVTEADRPRLAAPPPQPRLGDGLGDGK